MYLCYPLSPCAIFIIPLSHSQLALCAHNDIHSLMPMPQHSAIPPEHSFQNQVQQSMDNTKGIYRTLQKYLKRWRFMMPHLNEQIDVYFKVHYKVSEYNHKTLYPRSTIIPGRQYKAIRRQRLHRARQACLQAIALKDRNQRPSMAMVTYSRYPRRVHFDTDSYEILVDNCCSKSITNCLEDFIAPPRSSNMIIKGFNGATATTKVGTVQWRLQDDWASTHYNIARDLLL
jgi:hypothetical protein